MFRVGATLAVVPVRTTKKGPGKISTSLRGAKRRGDRRERLWCNPFSFRSPWDRAVQSTAGDADCQKVNWPEGPREATLGCGPTGLAMTCFFRRSLRNKHVGTPVPGCPPPLGASIRTPREGCPYRDPRRERRAAPSGACGEQPPKAALSERRRRSLREASKIAPRREPGGFGVT